MVGGASACGSALGRVCWRPRQGSGGYGWPPLPPAQPFTHRKCNQSALTKGSAQF